MNGTWLITAVAVCSWGVLTGSGPHILLDAGIPTQQTMVVSQGAGEANYRRIAHWSCQVGIPSWTLSSSTGSGTPPAAVLTL